VLPAVVGVMAQRVTLSLREFIAIMGRTTRQSRELAASPLKGTKTDNYGEFEFEGLDANDNCTVSIEHRGYAAREVKVKTTVDTYLGDILLSKTKAEDR
jgi:hypothetical protein